MPADALSLENTPAQPGPATMLLGFNGWMDGGDVSTGTIAALADIVDAQRVGQIDPHPFYIFNFPGSMEISAVFRPHVEIEDGLIRDINLSENILLHAPSPALLMFSGREPNINWREFADCLFAAAERFSVRRIIFLGSVGGVTPHTREPRIYCSMSSQALRDQADGWGLRTSQYEGPASFVTYMTHTAPSRDVEMLNLVAEIPAYVQGRNPKCIEAMTRKLSQILSLSIDLEPMRTASDDWERRVSEAVATRDDLAEHIEKLEADYDEEIFSNEMGDLKDWLEQRGIQMD